MTSPTDAPPPALGELARRVTMQEIEHRRDVANARAETHEGSPDYWQHCEERDFWFNVSALVALATGGATGGLQQEQEHLAETEKNQPREPVLTPSEPVAHEQSCPAHPRFPHKCLCFHIRDHSTVIRNA